MKSLDLKWKTKGESYLPRKDWRWGT